LLCCCQIYEGSDKTGKSKHTENTKPSDDITAASGKLFIEFKTNTNGNDVGFSAEFSIGNSIYCH